MKNRVVVSFLILLFCFITLACSSSDSTHEKKEIEMDKHGLESGNQMYYRSLDDREFLMEVAGFTAEQLENIDIEEFSSFVDLRTTKDLNFSKYAYDTEYDLFYNENYNDTYLILSVLTNDRIPKGTKIKKIGYTYNPNDYVLDAVFDIERKVFYVNDRLGKSNKYDEHRLDADLSGIVDEYEIYDWDTVIEDHTLGSTRSYGWKLVFLGDDGHKYAYKGFEMGKHVFPDGYDRLSKKLIEITETIYKK